MKKITLMMAGTDFPDGRYVEIQKTYDGEKIGVEKLKPGEVFGLLLLLDDKEYGIDTSPEPEMYPR